MAEQGPLSGIPIIGPILDTLASIFGNQSQVQELADAIAGVERNVWQDILGIAGWALGVLAGIVAALKSLIAKIWDWLKEFWRHLAGILTTIWNIVSNIVDQIRRLAKKISDIIERVRKWYRLHILKWQLLALNVLQAVRVFLAALRLLHVKWAAKLDADIAKIQGYVTLSIVDIVKTLNTLSNIVGLAIDPLMILRKDFFSATLFGGLSALKAAAGYGSGRAIFPDEHRQEKQSQDAVFGPAPVQTMQPDGSVTQDPTLDLIDQSLDQQARTLGITF